MSFTAPTWQISYNLSPSFTNILRIERRRGQKRALRLTGAERLLRAPTYADLEFMFSPGAEKKMQAYRSPQWTSQTPCEKRECTAYLIALEGDDDDDEMNRPVM